MAQRHGGFRQSEEERSSKPPFRASKATLTRSGAMEPILVGALATGEAVNYATFAASDAPLLGLGECPRLSRQVAWIRSFGCQPCQGTARSARYVLGVELLPKLSDQVHRA